MNNNVILLYNASLAIVFCLSVYTIDWFGDEDVEKNKKTIFGIICFFFAVNFLGFLYTLVQSDSVQSAFKENWSLLVSALAIWLILGLTMMYEGDSTKAYVIFNNRTNRAIRSQGEGFFLNVPGINRIGQSEHGHSAPINTARQLVTCEVKDLTSKDGWSFNGLIKMWVIPEKDRLTEIINYTNQLAGLIEVVCENVEAAAKNWDGSYEAAELAFEVDKMKVFMANVKTDAEVHIGGPGEKEPIVIDGPIVFIPTFEKDFLNGVKNTSSSLLKAAATKARAMQEAKNIKEYIAEARKSGGRSDATDEQLKEEYLIVTEQVPATYFHTKGNGNVWVTTPSGSKK